jgi:hypothetical protein
MMPLLQIAKDAMYPVRAKRFNQPPHTSAFDWTGQPSRSRGARLRRLDRVAHEVHETGTDDDESD